MSSFVVTLDGLGTSQLAITTNFVSRRARLPSVPTVNGGRWRPLDRSLSVARTDEGNASRAPATRRPTPVRCQPRPATPSSRPDLVDALTHIRELFSVSTSPRHEDRVHSCQTHDNLGNVVEFQPTPRYQERGPSRSLSWAWCRAYRCFNPPPVLMTGGHRPSFLERAIRRAVSTYHGRMTQAARCLLRRHPEQLPVSTIPHCPATQCLRDRPSQGSYRRGRVADRETLPGHVLCAFFADCLGYVRRLMVRA